MVRVVSQNFSPPRSRHSSGETDRDLAERANLALSTLGRKRVETPDCESSSDSFWDSELDGDHYDTLVSENGENSNDINGNEKPEKSDTQFKRKERRRERNKLSAQAYRQRRRHQNVKEQQTLHQLETENKRLHKLVETLEKKTEQAKLYLRGCSVTMPDILHPIGELDGACAEVADEASSEWSSHSNLNSSNSQVASPSSNHGLTSYPQPPPPSDVDFRHQSLGFSQVFPRPPLVNELSTHVPVTMNGNSPFTTPTQMSPTASPTPPTQLVINTSSLVGATYSPAEGTNPSAVTMPTYLAVPIENQNQCFANTNLNCNPLRTHPSEPCPSNSKAPNSPANGNSPPPAGASPLINVLWNVNTGNQWSANGNPGNGTIFKLVNMEMCNNNMVMMNSQNGNSTSDANGNSCDRNLNGPSGPNPQLMSFNLNLNQATGETKQASQHQEPSQSTQVKQPISVQYFFTPSDQAKSVSVQ